MSKHLTIVLKEMCDRVGARFESVDFQEQNWFWRYTWTADEEERFTKWLSQYLYDNREARKEICYVPRRNKKHLDRVARFFVCNYGWKLIGL